MSLPNLITVFRILLVPFFFTELLSYQTGFEHHRWAALALFLIASFTDALDGFIARITKGQTELGRLLDPLADKLLLLSAYLGILWVHSLPYRPPLWITVTVVFRDLLIVIGMLVIFFIKQTVQIRPNLLGKFTTAFQMITVVAILLKLNFSPALWNVMASLTILSCLNYIGLGMKQLKV